MTEVDTTGADGDVLRVEHIAKKFGALVLAELQDGFNLIGISANPYFIIQGTAILVAMIANVRLSRLRRTGRTL